MRGISNGNEPMLPGDDGCAGRTLWQLPHHTRFPESLVEIGYTRLTIKIIFRRMTGYLCAEAEARGLGPDAMNPAVMEELAEVCPQAVAVSTKGSMANIARWFAGYLVHAGVIEPVVPSPPLRTPWKVSAWNWNTGSDSIGGCTAGACRCTGIC